MNNNVIASVNKAIQKIKTFLKDKTNLIFILLFIIAISLFKIAFYGIDTYSLINSDNSLNVNGSIEIPKETSININTKMDDPYDNPLYVHIETPTEEYERYRKIEYLYKAEHKKELDLQPVPENERETQ